MNQMPQQQNLAHTSICFCCSAWFLHFFLSTVHEGPTSNLRPAFWRRSATQREKQLDVFPYSALQRGALLPFSVSRVLCGWGALSHVLPALRDLTLCDTEAHCGRHSSWCTFRQRNRRAKRRAHSCNGGREQRFLGLYAPQKATEKPAEAISS